MRLADAAAALAARLGQTTGDARRIWVSGSTGSGRRTIVEGLRRDPRFVVIELRDLEYLDAPIHGLVQAAAQLPGFDGLIADRPSSSPIPSTDLDRDLRVRANEVARQLATSGRCLVVMVPASWSEPEGADDPTASRRAHAFLHGLLAATALPVMIIGSMPGGLAEFETIDLERIRLGPDDVALDRLPQSLRAAADRLVRHMRSSKIEATPLELRLRLGLVQLGVTPATIAEMSLVALAKQLARRMTRPLANATSRLLLARGAIPRTLAENLAGLTGADLDLVMTCVAYGDAMIRVADRTRTALLEQFWHANSRLPHDDRERSHAILAEHYAHLDGKPRIDPSTAVPWLEKVHHLAHGGAATESSWSSQELFSRELAWAHARALSLRRQYDAAARLYDATLMQFGDHPYAHHYLAFNLDRAHGDRTEIERHYRTAVRLDPGNPWWNARLVTFLITHGTYDGARHEWHEARERVDPTGRQSAADSWLALHMHRWVARRWLTLGYVAEARAVLDEIPPRFVAAEAQLAALAREIEDAEEARRLGDSVYPPEVPLAQRWNEPRVLVARAGSGANLEEWWAGRVVAADPTHVEVVLAQRHEAQRATFEADAWKLVAGEPAEDAEGYVELGRYADGSRVVRRVPSNGPPPEADDLGYVMGRIASWQG